MSWFVQNLGPRPHFILQHPAGLLIYSHFFAPTVVGVGAFTEVLANAGLTFRAGDATHLAAARLRLLDDPSFAAVLGQRIRQRVRDFCCRRNMTEGRVRAGEIRAPR